MPERTTQRAADLHWLATLLTGRRDIAFDITMQAIAPAGDPEGFFSNWIQAWSRRVFIAKTIAAIREDLAASARRTAFRRAETSALPPRSWVLDRETTKSDLERALLPIDIFPRAVVLLLAYERVPLQDAAILLDSDPDLLHTALAAGLRDLTINLARMQGWSSLAAKSANRTREGQFV